MTPDHTTANDKLDDDYPAYTMGCAAEISAPPQRSCAASTRRNYSLRNAPTAGTTATRATSCAWPPASAKLVDQGTALDAACRIIILEDQLRDALELNAELSRTDD